MGPESAKSVPGQELVPVEPPAALARPELPTTPTAGSGAAPATPPVAPRGAASPIGRAIQALDDGRRRKGSCLGACKPADGEALTTPDAGRTTANYVDFLGRVEAWMLPDIERIDAIMDNLRAHRATDVRLFSPAHPRWEFVVQPKYVLYLNRIEPWWKVLRSLALKGRRFETWDAICAAVHEATSYWNAHRHPFIWGRQRRKRAARHPGIALVPAVA